MTKEAREAWDSQREKLETFQKSFLGLVALSVVLCAVSRGPEMLEGTVEVIIPLNLTAGHVVVFGPWVVLFWVGWQRMWAERLGIRARRLRSEQGPPDEEPAHRWIWLAIFLLPAAAILFLSVQFGTNMCIQQGQDFNGCRAFSEWQMFWDVSLFSSKGEKAAYSFGVSAANQENMPYIYPPFQVWAYIVFAALAAWWGRMTWLSWLVNYHSVPAVPRGSEAESEPEQTDTEADPAR